jgi:hypothetical protein
MFVYYPDEVLKSNDDTQTTAAPHLSRSRHESGVHWTVHRGTCLTLGPGAIVLAGFVSQRMGGPSTGALTAAVLIGVTLTWSFGFIAKHGFGKADASDGFQRWPWGMLEDGAQSWPFLIRLAWTLLAVQVLVMLAFAYQSAKRFDPSASNFHAFFEALGLALCPFAWTVCLLACSFAVRGRTHRFMAWHPTIAGGVVFLASWFGFFIMRAPA